MKVKIDIDGLSDAVQEELKNWQENTCNPVLNEAYKAGAEEGKFFYRAGRTGNVPGSIRRTGT